ncbi:MAG: alkyl sulfatase dimerization domain-containing protein [Desulfobacterales bacterium]
MRGPEHRNDHCSQDMAMLGILETLGIAHGRPFEPDERLRTILTEAAEVGRAMAKPLAWQPRIPKDTLYAYPEKRHWKYIFLGDPTFHTLDYMAIDQRSKYGFEAIGTPKSMVVAVPGQGSQYIGADHDSEGNWLSGENTYRIRLPKDVPANMFWSLTAYDNETRSLIQNDLGRPLVGSVHGAKPRHMRDGFETYGQVESHVKQVYNGRLGWMGNDVYDINPLAVEEESRRMVEMMGGSENVRSAARNAVDEGGFPNWSWALKLTSLLLEIDENDHEAQKIRAAATRALGQRTTSANARGWYITEALAMEKKLKLGDKPVTLGMVRVALGTPEVETIMSAPLEDSFQYVRYLVDPRQAEDTRLALTVSVEGAEEPTRIELRNGVIIISEVSKKEKVHIDVSSKEWAEFVVGKRSFADRDKTVAAFESVLAQPPLVETAEALDDQLDDVAEEVDDSNVH